MASRPGKRQAHSGRQPDALSKSKLMALRQCERRLWLEVHWPALSTDAGSSQVRKAAGHLVGDVAQTLYDAQGRGRKIDVAREGVAEALARTARLLPGRRPIFEAGFAAGGALAFADVLLPTRRGGTPGWRMVEVKSSTSVKEHHRDDVAVQCFAAHRSGLPLQSVSVAHVDSTWTYPGGGDYRGLLKEVDLTEEAFSLHVDVQEWIRTAHEVVAQAREPRVVTGAHCSEPHECGFREHCDAGAPHAEYPVAWLTGQRSKALRAHLAQPGIVDLRQVPDALLNARQRLVKTQTLAEQPWFDARGAARALRGCERPLCFLDFEAVQFAVPIWAGTRPYRQIPFQFSLHRLRASGRLEHDEYLDLSGRDPREGFAKALIRACAERGTVFVYNAAFERERLKELGATFPRMRRSLEAIAERVVDLLPVTQAHYYHPGQQGSWSLKSVLPTVAPDLRYDQLDEVQDGGLAMQAYLEAIAGQTSPARRATLRRQLLDYCHLDSLAMVRLWQFLSGHDKVKG